MEKLSLLYILENFQTKVYIRFIYILDIKWVF